MKSKSENARGARIMKTYAIVVEIDRYHTETRTYTSATYDEVVATFNAYAERHGYAILSIYTID